MLFVLLALSPLAAPNPTAQIVQEQSVPQYLYKVVATDNWAFSPDQRVLKLADNDQAFIHFSKEDQLEKTLAKFFSNVPEYVILKIETAKLPGKLVYEANPGGSVKYYHLYNGSVPHEAIADAQVVKN
jgi:uncharacterized protein (DUF952 family)